jgi:GNAT superfamily N-acetyltransferase
MIDYTLVPATEADYPYVRGLRERAMRPHYERVWKWDDNWQEDRCRKHFNPKYLRMIVVEGQQVGCISLTEMDEPKGDIMVEFFYIEPDWQNKGLGTVVLNQCLADLDDKGIVAHDIILKGSAWVEGIQRFGFEIVSEGPIVYNVTRQPKPKS